ncbi:DUF7118 family protein [Halorussus caseinilyticus]|uniref:Uncharacterized protein n=1 Tax=Halorussus caseinilyticus TaxID=3034025 RepID=A0ABD5WMI7_9EURY
MSDQQTAAARSDLSASLADADAAYRDVDADIADYGEATVETVADAYDRATDLLDRYEGQATGTGRENFKNFIQFQDAFASLVEDLPDEMPGRDAFEAANDRFDKRRLSEDDFERARADLEPAGEVAGLLAERRAALERYREVRREVGHAIADLREDIADAERLVELGEADLDAPIEKIRDPIETYNDAVSEAFAEFKAETGAREVLSFVAATHDYSLVGFRDPPETLREYVETREAGTETIGDLLEYARYSNSKLDHYVEDPAALKRAVATNETYLERLDADPCNWRGRRNPPRSCGGASRSWSRSSRGSPPKRWSPT